MLVEYMNRKKNRFANRVPSAASRFKNAKNLNKPYSKYFNQADPDRVSGQYKFQAEFQELILESSTIQNVELEKTEELQS